MTSDADVPGWIARLNRRAARRGDRCRQCGVRGNKSKLVATEAGMFCRPHADALPARIAHYDHDQENDE